METNQKPDMDKKEKKGLFSGLFSKKGVEKKTVEEKAEGNALTELVERAGESHRDETLAKKILNQSEHVDANSAISSVIARKNESQIFWGKVASVSAIAVLIMCLFLKWAFLSEGNLFFGTIGVPNMNFTVRLENVVDVEDDTKIDLANKREERDILLRQDGGADGQLVSDVIASSTEWSKQIDNLNKIVKKVSPYNPVTKKIIITNYNFDNAKKTVGISGDLQNPGADTVYTLAVNTVDAFGESPYFFAPDVNKYSAQKEKEGSGNYTSTLNLDLLIQAEGEEDESDNSNFEDINYSNLPRGRRYRNSGFNFDKLLQDTQEAVANLVEGGGESAEGEDIAVNENADEENLEGEANLDENEADALLELKNIN